jgi:hypothetical protein
MLVHRLGERAEDDPQLPELALEGGGDRDAVEHRVDRHPGEDFLLLERDAELLVGAPQLGIDLLEGTRTIGRRFRRRVIDDVVVVDGGVVDVGPGRLLHGEPVTVGLQPPVEHEGRLALLPGDETDHVLAQPLGDRVALHVGDETVLVILLRQVLEGLGRSGHHRLPRPAPPPLIVPSA